MAVVAAGDTHQVVAACNQFRGGGRDGDGLGRGLWFPAGGQGQAGGERIARLLDRALDDDFAALVVRVNKASTEIDADDPYAAFQIPDDLMW